MGSMVQSNSIAESCNTAFGVETWIVGAIVAVIAAFIFLGGIQRIASVTEKLVPIMAVLFLAGGLVVICFNITKIPETFAMIFKYAFTPNALIGGGIGYALKTAISQGAKRGLFSNEAGMGSTPHAHAQANVANPHEQGCVAMVGVFIDTFVVLTMTALVVITLLFTGNGPLGDAYKAETAAISVMSEAEVNTAYEALIVENEITANDVLTDVEAKRAALTTDAYNDALAEEGISKTNAMQTAFTKGLPAVLGNFGNIFVAICLLFFAFSTVISWNFFGKLNVQYMFKNSKVAVVIYSVIAIVFIFLGSLASNDLVWELTDFFNYLMVIPNAIALIALGKVVAKNAKNNKK